MHTLLHWLLSNGIGQNVTASVLIGAAVAVWARAKWLPRLRAHEERVKALHVVSEKVEHVVKIDAEAMAARVVEHLYDQRERQHRGL